MKLAFSRFSWGLVLWAIVCLTWLVGCQSAHPTGELVTVARVVSGQTIEVLDATGQNPLTERVVLLGVRAPDWQEQQPWSRDAKTALENLIRTEKTVRLEFDIEPERVIRDRTTQQPVKLRQAYVWQGQTLLNEKLVAEGWIQSQSCAPNVKYEQRLANAQEKARLTGLGIWNPAQPMRETQPSYSRCPRY